MLTNFILFRCAYRCTSMATRTTLPRGCVLCRGKWGICLRLCKANHYLLFSLCILCCSCIGYVFPFDNKEASALTFIVLFFSALLLHCVLRLDQLPKKPDKSLSEDTFRVNNVSQIIQGIFKVDDRISVHLWVNWWYSYQTWQCFSSYNSTAFTSSVDLYISRFYI